MFAVVITDYNTEEEGHISLQVGETIFLEEFGDDTKLWRGRGKENKGGYFPAHHVKISHNEATPPLPPPRSTKPKSEKSQRKSSISQAALDLETSVVPSRPRSGHITSDAGAAPTFIKTPTCPLLSPPGIRRDNASRARGKGRGGVVHHSTSSIPLTHQLNNNNNSNTSTPPTPPINLQNNKNITSPQIVGDDYKYDDNNETEFDHQHLHDNNSSISDDYHHNNNRGTSTSSSISTNNSHHVVGGGGEIKSLVKSVDVGHVAKPPPPPPRPKTNITISNPITKVELKETKRKLSNTATMPRPVPPPRTPPIRTQTSVIETNTPHDHPSTPPISPHHHHHHLHGNNNNNNNNIGGGEHQSSPSSPFQRRSNEGGGGGEEGGEKKNRRSNNKEGEGRDPQASMLMMSSNSFIDFDDFEEYNPFGEDQMSADHPVVIIDDVAKQKEMRKKCIEELYNTEKDYINDLEILINVFIFPLKLKHVLTEALLYNLFSNVEVLVNCNVEMLKSLESKMNLNSPPPSLSSSTSSDDDHPTSSHDEVLIGECFTVLADYFKMYKVYSANQQISLTTLDSLLKKNSNFKKALDTCQSDPQCRGLTLQSFLIKPIQRICKYPLLLRELIRYTPEGHGDYEALRNAYTKINEVVTNINEGQREAEGLQRILELQSLIDGIDTLVEPGRRYHKEGDLMFFKSMNVPKGEKRHVFFFSDLIVLTVRKGERRFEHKMSVPLESCKFIVLADSEHVKNAFELTQEQLKSKCILSCETQEELNQYSKDIRNLMKIYIRRKMQLREKNPSSVDITLQHSH